VIIAVPLFGERLTGRQVALMALAFGGVLAVVFGADSGGGASVTGDLLAVGSLFAMTGYLLLMKHARMAGVPAGAYVAGVFLVTAIAVTPIDLLWGDSLGAISGVDWLWVAMLALLAGCLGHTLMTWAQRHVNVGIASIMILGTTVVTAAGGWIFFDQALTALQIAGGAVVLVGLSGVLLVQIADPRRPAEVPMLVELAEPPLPE
jgi:drug/metabolite transporter (DMT)-like permease